MITRLLQLYQKYRLARLKRQGLQIAEDCKLTGTPDFGSEPYLVSIGKRVRMSGKVAFVTHDGATWVFRHQPKYRKVVRYGRITVHDGSFIGYRAIILPGVSIGPDAVVAAHAVVTRDVPPGTIVAGNPARVICSVADYAEKLRARTPDYDEEAYRRDKRAELLRLFPYPW